MHHGGAAAVGCPVSLCLDVISSKEKKSNLSAEMSLCTVCVDDSTEQRELVHCLRLQDIGDFQVVGCQGEPTVPIVVLSGVLSTLRRPVEKH